MTVLNDQEIAERLRGLPGWMLEGNAIRRTYTFLDFPEALSFAVNVGARAEAADHHPDISISYRKVTLSYSTHSEGGLTAKDFEGARQADAACPGDKGR